MEPVQQKSKPQTSNVIEPFNYDVKTNQLTVLDQRGLPNNIELHVVSSFEDAKQQIEDMAIRGAPSIAAFGCFAMIQHLNKVNFTDMSLTTFRNFVLMSAESLIAARPTAVNLRNAMAKLVKICDERIEMKHSSAQLVLNFMTNYCIEALINCDKLNRQMGQFGAEMVLLNALRKHQANYGPQPGANPSLNIVTHCNTGALATPGYGTALGVIRALHERFALKRVFCTETRPYNQGSRITAWELLEEKIPVTLIGDSMCAHLMREYAIDGVIVGADRIAMNGDTANKIGTLQLAIIANHYHVPFYVAAPKQTFDRGEENGDNIEIELRPADELRTMGSIQLAPPTVDAWNPSFDITPSSLITGYITEYGCCKATDIPEFLAQADSVNQFINLF